jgi:hypothetical protein
MGLDSTTPERALLEKVAAGGGEALAELARRHRAELLAEARKLGDHRAEDALELALASAYVAIREGARPDPVGPWLAGIVRDAARPQQPPSERPKSTASEGSTGVGSLRSGVERARRRLAVVAALPSPALWRGGIAVGVAVVATAVIAATLPDRGDGDRDRASTQAEDVVLIAPPSKPVSRPARIAGAEGNARPKAKRNGGPPRDRSAPGGDGSAASASSSHPSQAPPAPAAAAAPTATGSPGSTPPPAPTSPPTSNAPPASTAPAPAPTPSSPAPSPPASQTPSGGSPPPQSCPPVDCVVETVGDKVGGLLNR